MLSLLYFTFSGFDHNNRSKARHKENDLLDSLERELSSAAQWKTKNPDSALFILNNLAKKSLLLKLDQRFDFQARILTELGNIYRYKGVYPKAIKYYEAGIEFSIKHNLKLQQAKLLNSLGGVYQELEYLNKALELCKLALEIYQEQAPNAYYDLCMLHANVGNLQILNNNPKYALKYLLRAKELNDIVQDDYLNTLIFTGLGSAEMKMGNFTQALDYFDKGINAATKIQSADTRLAIIANTASSFIQMNRFDAAEKLLLPALQETKKIRHTYLTKEILNLLTMLYAENKQYEAAYQYQKEYIKTRSELFTEELNQRIASIEDKLKTLEREKRILALNQQNQRKDFEIRKNRYMMGLIAVILISIILILWFFYQRTKHKNIARIYLMQNQMFRLQMKPHFIFNVLSSIGGYMNQNNNKDAEIYLAKFARLIRNVLEQSNQELITLNKEIELLRYYLELQQLRFPNKFTFEINLDNIEETESLLVPPMMIQPLVENAIEHGFSALDHEGQLLINFTQSEDLLSIEIIDNGIGIKNRKSGNNVTDLSQFRHTSISSKLIKEHLKYYKIIHRRNFQITFDDLSEKPSRGFHTGTRIILTLPLIQNT
jgi:tetratricopeptide (TPR) repeat protein